MIVQDYVILCGIQLMVFQDHSFLCGISVNVNFAFVLVEQDHVIYVGFLSSSILCLFILVSGHAILWDVIQLQFYFIRGYSRPCISHGLIFIHRCQKCLLNSHKIFMNAYVGCDSFISCVSFPCLTINPPPQPPPPPPLSFLAFIDQYFYHPFSKKEFQPLSLFIWNYCLYCCCYIIVINSFVGSPLRELQLPCNYVPLSEERICLDSPAWDLNIHDLKLYNKQCLLEPVICLHMFSKERRHFSE